VDAGHWTDEEEMYDLKEVRARSSCYTALRQQSLGVDGDQKQSAYRPDVVV